jgi:hypothetical protein
MICECGLQKYKGQMDRVDFSGPLLSQPRRIDELLENHEQHIRRAGRGSWFRRGRPLLFPYDAFLKSSYSETARSNSHFITSFLTASKRERH